MKFSDTHNTQFQKHQRVLTCAVVAMLLLTGISQAALITNVSSNTGAGKAVYGGILAEASSAMTDRGHVYRQIPAFLTGQAEYIKTANDDKNSTTYRLTFTLTADADVYLFIDTRVNMDTYMTWVTTAGAVDTGSQIGLDESADGSINNWYKVYKKFCTAGTYTLLEQNAGDINMYGVAAAVPVPYVYTVYVDAQTNRSPISPYIYGTGGPNKNQHIGELNFVIDRMGGECETAYNWKQNAHNLCKNWWWISMGNGVPAGMYDDFFQTRRQIGAESALTITTSPWVAKLGPNNKENYSFSVAKYGPQTGVYMYNSDIGNGIVSEDPDTGKKVYLTGNDPHDAYIPADSLYQKEFVEHLINKFGLSTEGGVTNYIMDNEPFLWSSTHRDLYPGGITVKGVGDYIIDYAGRIRFLDPHAIIWGPELFNFWVFDTIPPLLQQLKEYKDKTGLDVLDVLTVHYYPSPCDNDITEAGQLHRNAATRTLWDPTYKDPRNNNYILNVIPRLQAWVDQYYPGLKTGITEWNWGAEDHINGATALADSYGIMGREGLDVATHWGSAPDDPARPTFKAMKMFRNYDGSKSTFGDISVLAAVPQPDLVSAFAAERTSDKALTVMVINKQLSTDEPVNVSLANFIHGGIAQWWQLTAANVITRQTDVSISSDVLEVTLPAQSINLFVIPNGTPLIAGQASNPAPVNGAANVSTTPTLTWTAGSNAFTHSVYLGTTHSAVAAATPASPEYKGTVYAASFKPATLSGSTTYYWRVDEQANGDPTTGPVWQFTTGIPPVAPAGLSASQIFDREARLAWNPAAAATSYKLKRSTRPDGPFVTVATTSAAFFTDSTMAAGVTYYFVVSSVNANGEGPDSAPIAVTTRVNFARGKTASASSVTGGNTAAKAVDGQTNSRWESQSSDPQWIQVDLGSAFVLDTYRIRWENAYSRAFQLQVSNNGTDWITIYSTTTNPGGVQVLSLTPVSAQYVRIYGTQRATTHGHSLWEFEVFGDGSTPPGQAVKPSPAHEAANVRTNTHLSWFAGTNAFMHQVYIGTDAAAVAAATTASPEYKGTFAFRDYKPIDLNEYTTYFWRVDEKGDSSTPTQGPVWSFTTGTYDADLNKDGRVSIQDLLWLTDRWLKCIPAGLLVGDLNNDNIINLKDFAQIAAYWATGYVPLVTDVSSNTGTGKAVHGGFLAEGSPAMTDRGHVYRQVPAFLAGQAEYIKTANDDKNSTTYRLTFTLTADADVYLFIDTRVNMDTYMTWVTTAGVVDTGSQIGLDEGNNGSIDRWCKVYRKSLTPGTYSVNEQAAGDYNMYGVAAVAH